VQLLRQHYDAEWVVLSLRELREYERVQLIWRDAGEGARATLALAVLDALQDCRSDFGC
jgi:hypothetical protein